MAFEFSILIYTEVFPLKLTELVWILEENSNIRTEIPVKLLLKSIWNFWTVYNCQPLPLWASRNTHNNLCFKITTPLFFAYVLTASGSEYMDAADVLIQLSPSPGDFFLVEILDEKALSNLDNFKTNEISITVFT